MMCRVSQADAQSHSLGQARPEPPSLSDGPAFRFGKPKPSKPGPARLFRPSWALQSLSQPAPPTTM